MTTTNSHRQQYNLRADTHTHTDRPLHTTYHNVKCQKNFTPEKRTANIQQHRHIHHNQY